MCPDQHYVPAGGQEYFFTLYILPEFIKFWSHSISSNSSWPHMALLDALFLQYQHACIATVETNLNAGTVFVTLFPNLNMSIAIPLLLEALKVQIQIIGVAQDSRAHTATLAYQMVYRVQNHAMDLSLPGSNDAFLLSVDEQSSTTCQI